MDLKAWSVPRLESTDSFAAVAEVAWSSNGLFFHYAGGELY